MDEIDKLHIRMQGLQRKIVAAEASLSATSLGSILNRNSDPRLKTVNRINEALDRLGAKRITHV